jgi:hypothetical protein
MKFEVRCPECGARWWHEADTEPEFVDCVQCGRTTQDITRIDAGHYSPSYRQP